MWCQILFWHALHHTHFEDPFVISYYGWLYEIVSCAGTLPQSLWWSLKWLLSEDWKGRSHCLPGEFTIQYRRFELLLVINYILMQTANPQIILWPQIVPNLAFWPLKWSSDGPNWPDLVQNTPSGWLPQVECILYPTYMHFFYFLGFHKGFIWS